VKKSSLIQVRYKGSLIDLIWLLIVSLIVPTIGVVLFLHNIIIKKGNNIYHFLYQGSFGWLVIWGLLLYVAAFFMTLLPLSFFSAVVAILLVSIPYILLVINGFDISEEVDESDSLKEQ